MNSHTYTTTGTFTDTRTLILDEPLPETSGRVRVTIEKLPGAISSQEFLRRLQAIHAALRSSGILPPTISEVEERLQAERDSWD